MKKTFADNAFVILAVALALTVLAQSCTPYDDTDDVSTKTRSGVLLITDYGTGCQYLATGGLFGAYGITPRMDSDGNHICNAR